MIKLHTIARNISSGIFSQVWTAALGLIVLPIYVRRMGPASYGLFAMCLTVVGIGGMMDLGIGRSLGKFIAETQDETKEHAAGRFFRLGSTMALGLGCGAGLALVAMSGWITRDLYHVPAELHATAVHCLLVTALGLPAVLLRLSLEGLLTGYERIAYINTVNAVANTVKAVGGVAAILARWSLPWVLFTNVAALLFASAALLGYARFRMPAPFRLGWEWEPRLARQVLRLGGLSTLCLMMGTVFLNVDRLIVTATLPFVWLGYYSASYDLTCRQATISNNVASAFLPAFSAHAADHGGVLTYTYRLATRAVAAGTSGVAAILMVLAHPLLRYFLGADMAAHATPIAVWLSLGILLNCYTNIPYTLIFAAAARPEVFIGIYCAGAVVHIALSLLLVHAFGAAGVAAAFAAGYLVVWALALVWVRRHLVATPVAGLLRAAVVPPCLIAAAVALPLGWLLRDRIHSLVDLLAACALGYAVYLIALALTAFSAGERRAIWSLGRGALGLAPSRATVES